MALEFIKVDCTGFFVMVNPYWLEGTNPKVVPNQNVAAHSGLKTDKSQDHGQTASSITSTPSSRSESPSSTSESPRSRSGLPSSRSGSPNYWIGSSRSRSGSPSPLSEWQHSWSISPSFNSGSPSSRSWSLNYTSGSSSSRSGSPNFKKRSPSCRSWSESSWSGSPNFRSKASSSRSGSPSYRSGSSSSRSGSPSPLSEWQHSWSTSPSSNSGSPSSKSRSPPNENTDLSGLDLPPAGIEEYYSGNEADTAFGQNCSLEWELIADKKCSIRKLLPCHIHDVDDKEVETCKRVFRSLRENNDKLSRKTCIDKLLKKTDIEDPCMKTTFGENSRKINIGKLFSKSIIVADSFSKTAAEDVARKTYIDELCRETGVSDSCGKISNDEVFLKTSVEEVSRSNAVDEVSRSNTVEEVSRSNAVDELLHPTANEIIVSDFQSESLFSQSDKYANVVDKSTFILSDSCSQPEPKNSFGVISEQRQSKCHLDTDRYEDCDKDHESSQIRHVECLVESLDDCKKGNDGDCVDDCTKKEDGDAAEQTLGNISIQIDDNASLEDGTGCKQDTENLLIRLKTNDKVPESLSETISNLSHRLSVFGYSFNYVLRKAFPKNENYADTEDNDLPCKNKGLCDVSDSQFEENVPGCTEIYCSKSMSKAVARRAAEEMSYKHCICSHQRCSHRRKCMCSHEAVSRLSSAEVGDRDFEHSLGILMRFDPVRHMPWRHYIQTYIQPLSVTSTLYDFMNFEAFRLSSFDLINFPKDDSSVVTNLAKSGFYFVGPTVQIICFECGNKYERPEDSSASSADSFHHPECTRHISNIPLDQFVQGLNPDALAEYFIQNGSLTPYVHSKKVPSVADSAERCTPTNVPKAGPVSDLQLPTSGYSSEHESGGFQHVDSEREADRDSRLSANDSNTGNNQEQSESDRSHLILTSATKWPVWFGSANSGYAEVRTNAAAEGAVGGIPILNLDSALFPHFSVEAVRRKSFTDWNPRHSHKPDDLAAAGFFYAGYSDCVRCFYCGLGLKFWRPEDIPAYQHARYRPHCQFNRFYKGQEYIDQVLQEQRSEQLQRELLEVFPYSVSTVLYFRTFLFEAVRRKSFTDWNPRHSHKPDDLAAAGFFYAGYSDCVRCFYCGLDLKFWRPEDIPAYQHARYRPHCQFNRLYKGQEYIDQVLQEQRSEQEATEGAVGGIPILSLDSALFPHFSVEAVRRKSFTDWNPRHSHKPDDMAAAGFFYAGYSDCVRCFYCGLGLKFWRPEDIPAYQHARYRPHCQFNRLYKGQEYIDQVLQEQRSEQGATDIVETQTAPTDMVEIQTAPTHSQDSVQAISTAQVTSGPQELDYLNSEATRQALRDG